MLQRNIIQWHLKVEFMISRHCIQVNAIRTYSVIKTYIYVQDKKSKTWRKFKNELSYCPCILLLDMFYHNLKFSTNPGKTFWVMVRKSIDKCLRIDLFSVFRWVCISKLWNKNTYMLHVSSTWKKITYMLHVSTLRIKYHKSSLYRMESRQLQRIGPDFL